MNCFECAHGDVVAVAVCGRCGAGVCRAHAVAREDVLTATLTLNAVVEVTPAARRIRCGTCDVAESAQAARGARRRTR